MAEQAQKPKKNPFATSEGFASAKSGLKKSKKTEDKSGPKLTGYVTREEIENYDNYLKTFDIEAWYEALKDITFLTAYVDITVAEARIIADLCAKVTALAKKKQMAALVGSEDEKSTDSTADSDIDVSKALPDLIARIDKTIASMNDNPNDSDFGVFAKLSSRSAKDATDAEERLEQLYKEYIKSAKIENDNDKVRELLRAATHCMKVSSGKAICKMFIHSDRISNDINSALRYPDKFDQHVVIRKWVPIDIDMEFRAFVRKGKMNALSQYNYMVYFERLVKMKKPLEKLILDFFEEKCKDALKNYDGYIIDFAVTGANLDTILVIELNPFMESTDGALFSWKQERNALENGPFEFRIRDRLWEKRPPIEEKYRILMGWEQ